MPVNTAALKTFAPAMRRQLLEAVGRKLNLLLNSQTPDTLSTYAKQIGELREQQAENRDQLLERVAYTWFNRLCALRYLDARGWHPFGCKVLMPAADGETQPELLKLIRAGSLPAELKPLTNEARLHGLLDGQIPPAIAGSDPQGEVYRELVLASCRSYHQLLPELFEGLDDASELLLPDDLLSEGSIAGGFRNAISDADCEDVEIIGWLYQFYISEKKDQVIGKVVKSEDIPAATQLFTPNWIVKYMVQNSLGAIWLATYPDSPLKGQMEFYIEPAEQAPEVQAQLSVITPENLDPEALTLIDPACGSGHILVEAYNLLKAIYLERGYRQRDIPELILTKNLFGLDICPRAAQLAGFSVLMKGREDDRRLLERDIQINVMALQNSTGLNLDCLVEGLDLAANGVSRADARILVELFTHATTFGTLIQVPAVLADKLPALSRLAEQSRQDLFLANELERFGALVRQAEILTQRYDAVVANPPYMGSKYQDPLLRKFAIDHQPESKADLFSLFIDRGIKHTKPNGRAAFVTPFVWMFILTFEKFRKRILKEAPITSLVQLEYNAFEPACVPVCTFILRKNTPDTLAGQFIRLSEFKGHENQAPKTLEAIRDPSCKWRHKATNANFRNIPGSPIAYWIGKKITEVFMKEKSLHDIADVKVGLWTGANDIFMRAWHEVSIGNSCFNCKDNESQALKKYKWFPCSSGGKFRKWYGNQDTLVNYKNAGEEVEEYSRSNPNGFGFSAQAYYFKKSISWSKLTNVGNSFRYYPGGFLFDGVGLSAFPHDSQNINRILAYANNKYVSIVSKILNPTMTFTAGNFGSLPFPSKLPAAAESICEKVVHISRTDWDAYERSWDFQSPPLLTASNGPAPTLESSYTTWITQNKVAIADMRRLEEENNRLFIEAYGLDAELTPDVPVDEITLTVNPAYRYGGDLTEEEKWERFQRDSMVEYLSYAIGCIIGRYSLDQPGLILADSRDSQAEQLVAYEDKVGKPISEVQFKPDSDGIIPVLDGEWFEDDIVARTREFLEVTFPESTVTENLRFIEESLGKDIRKYFCSEFYKDHLQTYKKRPIYWLLQSPKKGFSCLIYLHRYTKDTLNQVLNNYFRPYLQKLEARLAQLGLDQLNDDLPARERTSARKEAEKIAKVFKECQAWEQDALLPLAQQRIELDLDDGVKVNYLKLQDVLAPIPGLAAKEG